MRQLRRVAFSVVRELTQSKTSFIPYMANASETTSEPIYSI